MRESSVGTWSSKTLEPHVVRMPLVCVRSLMVTGTPWSAPIFLPFLLRAAVATLASRSADSRASVTMALSFGLTASTRASTACITSRGEVLPVR